MNKENIIKNIRSGLIGFDVNIDGKPCSNGWKISIQGKCVEDSIELLNMMFDYLSEYKVAYKVATSTRFNYMNEGNTLRHREQSRKAFTIYCPNDIPIARLCKEINFLTRNYTGWTLVSMPTSYTHYSGGLYFRCDMDEDNLYIMPDNIV